MLFEAIKSLSCAGMVHDESVYHPLKIYVTPLYSFEGSTDGGLIVLPCWNSLGHPSTSLNPSAFSGLFTVKATVYSSGVTKVAKPSTCQQFSFVSSCDPLLAPELARK